MYELKNGSSRMISAMWRRLDDSAFVANLARLLNYEPNQLRLDIQALGDLYDEHFLNDDVED